jgi:hypothetical protein
MPKRHRSADEPDESTNVEQTEDDSEGHGAKAHFREDEESPDHAEKGAESDDGDDSEGHAFKAGR